MESVGSPDIFSSLIYFCLLLTVVVAIGRRGDGGNDGDDGGAGGGVDMIDRIN